MRMNTLLILTAIAGTAALGGCGQSQNQSADAGISKTADSVSNVIRPRLESVTRGETITGTDPDIRRYGPMTVYIPPGETPPYGSMRQRVMSGEFAGYASEPNGWYASQGMQNDERYEARQEPSTVAEDWTGRDQEYRTVYGTAALTPDNKALSFIHAKNTEEILAGNLAAQKGSSRAVREYGELLASDHRSADEKVTKLATSQKAILMSSSKPKEDPLARLSTLDGSDFDRAFAQEMVSGHEKVIAKLEKMRDKVSPSVRQLIDETLPTLRTHLEKARALQQ